MKIFFKNIISLLVLSSALLQGLIFRKGISRRNLSPLAIAFDSPRKIDRVLVNTDAKIDLLYDSECPICAMEVEFLKKRDIDNRIRFTDLSAPDYNPSDHGNVQFSEGMRKIRAVMPDKTVISGVEVFRQIYSAIGLGWIFHATSLPIIGKAADSLYDIWAENRLRITGRGELADVLRERSEALKEAEVADCESDACELNWDD